MIDKHICDVRFTIVIAIRINFSRRVEEHRNSDESWCDSSSSDAISLFSPRWLPWLASALCPRSAICASLPCDVQDDAGLSASSGDGGCVQLAGSGELSPGSHGAVGTPMESQSWTQFSIEGVQMTGPARSSSVVAALNVLETGEVGCGTKATVSVGCAVSRWSRSDSVQLDRTIIEMGSTDGAAERWKCCCSWIVLIIYNEPTFRCSCM